MTPSITRTATSVCAVAGAACLVGLAVGAGPADAAPSGMTAADIAFVTANQQSNLAEISLAKLGNSKGQDDATHRIADMTGSDHTKLKSQLSSIATKANATQPTAPNAMQQAVAAKLTSASTDDFDLMFAQAEVTGHKLALAGAQKERDTTDNASLKAYAANYLEVATPHLTMSQDEVDALGGAPDDVPAGTGGAASTSGSATEWGWVAGGGVLLVAAGATLGLRRRATR